jgi:YVTN family beta-propeller protein
VSSIGLASNVRTLALIVSVAATSTLTSVEVAEGSAGVGGTSASAALARFPLNFEPNHGQTDAQVQFLSRGSGYTLLLAPTEAVIGLGRDRTVRMRLENANRTCRGEGVEPLAGRSHYLIGSNREGWHTGIPQFGKVLYRNIYPGIDLAYYGTRGRIEQDFIVAPGADPGVIRLSFEGLGLRLRIEGGDLVIDDTGDELRFRQPEVYQEIDGVRRLVAGEWVLESTGHRVGFRLGAYDTTQALVIDPVLEYSHSVGGTSADFAADVALDGSGNVYLTGGTESTNFPGAAGGIAPKIGVGGGRDIFVIKLDPAGEIVFSTYIGGRGTDYGESIAVEGENAYVAGTTRSLLGFPGPGGGTPNLLGPLGGTGMADALVVKLTADGSDLEYATLFGGTDDDQGHGIAVASGRAFIVGTTASRNFPTDDFSSTVPAKGPAGGKDAFVAKLGLSGLFEYSTYLGGNNAEDGFGIVAFGAGSVYVTGQTCSGSTITSNPATDFPTSNAFQNKHQGGCDAFVTSLGSTTGIGYSTYLGGGGWDRGIGIAVDGPNVWVTGETAFFTMGLAGFPVAANALQPGHGGGAYDAFVTKLAPNQVGAGQLVYSTLLGGTGDDYGSDIAIDAAGGTYVTGTTGSASGFPTLDPLSEGGSLEGPTDAFVIKLKPFVIGLSYSTYLGGMSDEIAGGIALDDSGNAYVVGGTVSADFPGPTGDATKLGLGGGGDAFVSKLVATCPGTGPFAYALPSVIDTANDCLVKTIPGTEATGLAVSPDGGSVFTSRFQTVSFIDPVTKQVNDQMPVEITNVSLQGAVVSPDGKKLYVSAHTDNAPNKLYVFDTKTAQLLEVIEYAPDDPMSAVAGAGLVFHPDGTKLYVANNHSGTLDILDAITKSKIKSIFLNWPVNITGAWGIAITPDGRWIYVAGGSNNDRVAVIDAQSETWVNNITVADAAHVATTPGKVPGHGYLVYVTADFSADLTVIDTDTQTIFHTEPDAGGGSVAVTPNGKKVFVISNNIVKVIDAETNHWTNSVPIPWAGKVLGSFIGPQDRDKDGINDSIDGTWDSVTAFVPNPAFSDDFTDQHLGGTSSGEIVIRDGLNVSVWDAFNPSGFYARATGGAGTAVINQCGLEITLTANDEVKTLCGSLTMEVLSGPVAVSLGGGFIVSVPSGGALKVSELAAGQFTIENQGGVTISILDSRGQMIASLPAGQSFTFQACPCQGPTSGGSWKNHGQYVSCMERFAQGLAKAGLISEKKRAELVNEAAKSDCGKKK